MLSCSLARRLTCGQAGFEPAGSMLAKQAVVASGDAAVVLVVGIGILDNRGEGAAIMRQLVGAPPSRPVGAVVAMQRGEAATDECNRVGEEHAHGRCACI